MARTIKLYTLKGDEGTIGLSRQQFEMLDVSVSDLKAQFGESIREEVVTLYDDITQRRENLVLSDCKRPSDDGPFLIIDETLRPQSVVEHYVAAWTLVDDAGLPVPADAEGFLSLPPSVAPTVYDAIESAVRPSLSRNADFFTRVLEIKRKRQEQSPAEETK